ncbi:MAG: lytic transglycosylase domain-containing protein [Sphingobium sp.]|nr:lytic transglycosylase domain-containing protein [Sphingobium sp.]
MKRRVFILALAFSMQQACAPVAVARQADALRSAHPYAPYVTDAARRFDIPEAWIWAVMRVESNGDVRAISSAGAMGLMQIMPATWASLRARHRLGHDPYDPRDNIMAGAAYLRAMWDRYGNVAAMLAAYNAGPGRMDDYMSRGRSLPAETHAYLAKLAPIIGGASDPQLRAPAPPDPFAWHRAALFTARAGDSPTAMETTPVRTDAGRPANNLFVPLSRQRQP